MPRNARPQNGCPRRTMSPQRPAAPVPAQTPEPVEPMRLWKHTIPGPPQLSQPHLPAAVPTVSTAPTATSSFSPQVRLVELAAEQTQLLSDLLEAVRQLNATALAKGQ